jgi:hypothetical protein
MSVTAPPEESLYDRWTLKDPLTLDYGYFGSKPPTSATGGYYITTAINYTNGPAHMGHAYEAATADVLARFARLRGEEDVYFVTGTDEHGQKVAKTAADQGKEPIEICDTVSQAEATVATDCSSFVSSPSFTVRYGLSVLESTYPHFQRRLRTHDIGSPQKDGPRTVEALCT